MLGGAGGYYGGVEGSSLVPWLKNISTGPGFGPASSAKYSYYDGSISAPVTSPTGSPPRMSRLKTGWGEYPSIQAQPPWVGLGAYRGYDYSLPNSRPPSPRVAPDPNWLSGFQISSAGPASPTRNLPPNPFGAAFGATFKDLAAGPGAATAPSTRVHSPVQSGACSPAIPGEVPMDHSAEDDFDFGGDVGMVMAWEGEDIREVTAEDELELTLGSSKTRGGVGAAGNA